MGGDNVEQLWYGLYLIETVLILFVLSVAVLLCKRFLRSIPRNRLNRRAPKHPMVHPLGTVQNSQSAASLDSGDTERRIR
jgi:hypothetical protein